MRIVSTSEHLKRLRLAVSSIEDHDELLFDSMKLFEYAGNIENIEYNSFTEAGMYCRGVHEYELIEKQTLEPYLTNHAIFSMAWMGLESTINNISFINIRKGKINTLCSELKSYSSTVPIPIGYKKCLLEWVEVETKLNDNYKSRKDIPKFVDIRGEGIYRVYSLRNHLAHGDFKFILPTDPLWDTYIESLKLGSRIIAYTVQMLLMGYFRNKEYVSTWWHGSLQEYTDQICIEKAFKFLHLEWL